MFQQISRLSNRTACSIGHLKLLAGNRFAGIPTSLLEKNEKDATKQKSSVRFLHPPVRHDAESAASLSTKPAGDFGELFEKLTNCENVQVLLDTIEPYLTDDQQTFDVEQLTAIFKHLIELRHNLRPTNHRLSSLKQFYDLYDRNEDAWRSFKVITSSSASMRLLLHRAYLLIDSECDKRFLLALLGALARIKEDPVSRVVQKTTQELSRRLENLDSAELLDCLVTSNLYLNNPLATHDLFEFHFKVLQVAKRRILDNQLDPNDTDTTIEYLFLFLKNESRHDFAVSELLINRLLSPSLRPSLTFEHYVHIAKRIHQSCVLDYLAGHTGLRPVQVLARQYYRLNRNASWPPKRTLADCVFALAGRCNQEIHRTLSEQPTDENFEFYYISLASRMIKLSEDYSPFYENLESLIVSHLCQKTEREVYGRLIGDQLLQNCRLLDDGLLVKLFYEQFCSNEALRSQVNLANVYIKLARRRFPFVDHNLLASKLMSSVDVLRKSLNKDERQDLLRMLNMLSMFVLHDVTNEQLYDCLGELIDERKAITVSTMSLFKYFALANAYLQTPLCQLDRDLRTKVRRIFADQLKAISLNRRRPPIVHSFIDWRIQSNGYLSNGILLDHWVIFDRSTGDLLPLYPYLHYFECVDQIPLTDQQQL